MNFIVPLVVYPFDVMVSFGQTDQQLSKSLKKYNIEWEDIMKCEGSGRFVMNKDNTSIIRLWNIPETVEDYGTLQHEIFHAVTHIMSRIGMKLIIGKSDEAYSYLIGFLTKEIYKKIDYWNT